MSNIAISNLHPTDFDLLSDSESYIRELSEEELTAQIHGGTIDAGFVGILVGSLLSDLVGLAEWIDIGLAITAFL